ncbi:MAG: hypothetical protein J6V64_02665 [Burkholderiaceae bacterium]|nr:hypothetical protein [Burkholderiaceae bacterium]
MAKVWIRRILNILFWLVLIYGLVVGWNLEDKDPESFFPGFLDSPKAEAPAQSTPPKAP